MNRDHEKQQGGQKQGGQQHQQGNPVPRPGDEQQGGGARNPGQNPDVNDETKDRGAPAK